MDTKLCIKEKHSGHGAKTSFAKYVRIYKWLPINRGVAIT